MKLKGWGNRAYNIFFHLHTVGGIVISVALFIIFFAGAFTLFKNEFYLWENPAARHHVAQKTDVEAIFRKIDGSIRDFDLNDDTFIAFPTELSPIINIFGHIRPEGAEEEIHYVGKMDPSTLEIYETPRTTTGETLYLLHFLDQLPYAGRWIAGFVSLFFIFVTITGVLVHWRKMFTDLWAFSLKGSWKKIWTNSHTVFGFLGLPYQLMYAVTGAFYLLLILVLMPAVMLFYEGSPEKIYALAFPSYGVRYEENAPAADHMHRLAVIHQKVAEQYGRQFNILGIQTHHMKKADGVVSYRLESRDGAIFSSQGYIGFRLSDGSVAYSSIPGEDKLFTHKIVESLSHLHFATFGGLFIKFIYFLMALFTCFVIISGILLWKEARNKAGYTDRQKRFHHRVTIIFLSVCFGLFPATAVLFNAELALGGGESHISRVNSAFFLSWLLLTIAGIWTGNERKLTRFYLISGGILSVLIPVTNGLMTGDWLWSDVQSNVKATDIFWLITGIICLVLAGDILRRKSARQPGR